MKHRIKKISQSGEVGTPCHRRSDLALLFAKALPDSSPKERILTLWICGE